MGCWDARGGGCGQAGATPTLFAPAVAVAVAGVSELMPDFLAANGLLATHRLRVSACTWASTRVLLAGAGPAALLAALSAEFSHVRRAGRLVGRPLVCPPACPPARIYVCMQACVVLLFAEGLVELAFWRMVRLGTRA